MTRGPEVVRIAHLDLRFTPQRWDFAESERSKILSHFETARQSKPSLWNGDILLMHEYRLSGDLFEGSYFRTDFASFLAWRDWGFPDGAVCNCFALGALRGSDGGFVLGVMSAGTANEGRIYFPGGTPDPKDIVNDRVDLEASVARELAEETGLDMSSLEAGPDWHAVLAGKRIAMVKSIRSPLTAGQLQHNVLAFLAGQDAPELCGVRVARGLADLDAKMPDFVRAYLRHAWRGDNPTEGIQ